MLEINNLSLTFNKGSFNEKVGLKNINLTINDGEFITIIGGNGAGKSTFLNCIAGSYKQNSGTIKIDGAFFQDKKEYLRAQHIGRLFQDPSQGTAPDLDIKDNLLIALTRGRKLNFFERYFKPFISNYEREIIIEKIKLLNLGLENRLTTKVSLLSGGQRQALSLIMATINKPKLLLLDEHTAALDPISAEHIMKITNNLVQNDKITTLMITHNIEHALKYGNRLILMQDGQIIKDYKLEEKQQLTKKDIINIYNKEIIA